MLKNFLVMLNTTTNLGIGANELGPENNIQGHALLRGLAIADQNAEIRLYQCMDNPIDLTFAVRRHTSVVVVPAGIPTEIDLPLFGRFGICDFVNVSGAPMVGPVRIYAEARQT